MLVVDPTMSHAATLVQHIEDVNSTKAQEHMYDEIYDLLHDVQEEWWSDQESYRIKLLLRKDTRTPYYFKGLAGLHEHAVHA